MLPSIQLRYDSSNVEAVAAAGMVSLIDMVDALDQKLADPNLPLPGDQAERYLWIRRSAQSLKAIRAAAEEAALTIYVEVMGSDVAKDIYQNLRESMPCQ